MSIDSDEIGRLLDRMAEELDARALPNPALVGVHSGGVLVAEALRERRPALAAPGSLDISFYRDDFSRRGLNPGVRSSRIPFDVNDRHLVLVDDVLMSGRTVRAALNELFDYGRPASITLVVLFDVGRRELPIQADICGKTLALEPGERVELHGPGPLYAEILTSSQVQAGT